MSTPKQAAPGIGVVSALAALGVVAGLEGTPGGRCSARAVRWRQGPDHHLIVPGRTCRAALLGHQLLEPALSFKGSGV